VRTRKRLGVDIGTTYIKCVEVTRRGRNLVVTAMGKTATPKNAVQKGSLANPLAVAEALRGLLEEMGVLGKTAVLGITSPDVMVKSHRMPLMKDKELGKALEFELAELVNFPFDDVREVSYDFAVLNRNLSDVEILFVACRRALLDPFLNCLEDVGLEVAVIDLQAFNWPRLKAQPQRVCYVDVGEEQTTLYVELEHTYKVYRILPIGGFHFTQGIMQAFACGPAEARKLKEERHLDFLLTQGTGQLSTVRSVFEQYIAGILQTLDFVRAEERATHIREVLDSVYILGGMAHLQGFQSVLKEEIDLDVAVLNPFENTATAEGVEIPEDFASYASALALAIRGVEE
jgi:type IV pilus assembly protein PilM